MLAFRIMKHGSTNKVTTKSETILQCLLFCSLFFNRCLKNKRGIRLKYFLVFFCLPVLTHWLVYPSMYIQFFTLDFIFICNVLGCFHFKYLCKFYTISKFKRINSKSFYRTLLILSGEIDLQPGPVYDSQSSSSDEWNVFESKGIHLILLNTNNLLPKIG